MKLHELYNLPLRKLIQENDEDDYSVKIVRERNSVTLSIPNPNKLVAGENDLIDPETGKYFTGIVNAECAVSIVWKGLKEIPVQFGKVDGDFRCYHNELKSLEGAPREVGGKFESSENKLTSFEGAPEKVGGDFNVADNKITSLEGIHKIIKKIDGKLSIVKNPIKSGGIGLLLIEGLTHITTGTDYHKLDHPAFKIINKYFGQGKKGLLACQEELIEAGFEEYAKL